MWYKVTTFDANYNTLMIWKTKIIAIDPLDGELKEWGGPGIVAASFEDAVRITREEGMGYCEVIQDIFIEEVEAPELEFVRRVRIKAEA